MQTCFDFDRNVINVTSDQSWPSEIMCACWWWTLWAHALTWMFIYYRATQLCWRGLGSRNSVRPSVCPSVTLVLCDWSKEPTGDIFIPHERAILLVSERELTFTFAICYRPSVCRLSSVFCRLSPVCNTRAPYSGDSNFRQYFYGIRYPSHPLTSTENFTEIVPGEPLRRGS